MKSVELPIPKSSYERIRRQDAWVKHKLGEIEQIRPELCIILEWIEQQPNDEMTDSVRRAAGKLNRLLGVPSK